MNNSPSNSQWLLRAVVGTALVRLFSLPLYPLMDTTEARYAEISRKMLELGDWVTPWFDYGTPFWGKPPLSFWMTAASFKLFGASEFSARLPHWLAGMLAAWLIWDLAKRHASAREASYALALTLGAFVFYVAAGAVMTDMALLLGTVLTLRGFWLGLHGTVDVARRERWLLFVGIAIGLLAKGPLVIVLVLVPIVVWSLATRQWSIVWKQLPWCRGLIVTLFIAMPWYVLAELKTPGFLEYFLVGEHWNRFLEPGWQGDLYGSAHERPPGTIWLYAFVALLPWTLLLPATALLLRKSLSPRRNAMERQWRLYLLCWGLTPCVFFAAARNILPAYVLPAVPALALWGASHLIEYSNHRRVERVLTGGLVASIAALAITVSGLHVFGLDEQRSAKALISDYRASQVQNEPLLVLGRRTFSAEFYGAGDTEPVPDSDALIDRLGVHPVFLAIRTTAVDSLPSELVRSLTPVSRRGNFVLFCTICGNRPSRRSATANVGSLRGDFQSSKDLNRTFGHE